MVTARRPPCRHLLPLLVVASLSSIATMVRADSFATARDRFARIIDRSDAVVLGRVLEAGTRWIPTPGFHAEVGESEAYARIAVERWIAGPDTDSVVEVRLGHHSASPSSFPRGQDKRVIAYLLLSRGRWWLQTDIGWRPDRPAAGLEVLSLEEAFDRIPAIRKSAESSSPESMAGRADLAVVGALDRFTESGMHFQVERVLFGAVPSPELTVVTRTPEDRRLGPALLLLERRADSTWEPLDDGAGCYYLDQDRVAHLAVPAETLYSRVTAAHARRAKGVLR